MTNTVPYDDTLFPRPRCRGDCCRCFTLERNLEAMDESNPDTAVIRDMVIPLQVVRGQKLYTCRHLGEKGDCTIYERRPQMCRDFPGPNPCPYRNCASHGEQGWLRKAWNWLRD